jgi:hypothetical protein
MGRLQIGGGIIMQNSSDDFIDVTNDVGLSGKFIRLARERRLEKVCKMVRKREDLVRTLDEVVGALRACHDQVSLARLEKWCRERKRDFEVHLRKTSADAEQKKGKLMLALQEIEQWLAEEELICDWTIDPGPMTSLVPTILKRSDPLFDERNAIIDANPRLRHLAICQLLDQKLALTGDVSSHLPNHWINDFGVSNFTEAYLHPKCRNRVQRMISGRRTFARDLRPTQ